MPNDKSLFHEKVNGEVPPNGDEVIEPSHKPKQLGEVGVALTVNPSGSSNSTIIEFEHAFASVI